MKKKVVILGGGTGMSTLLKGLKEFPVEITSVVSVCDDGQSTGRLREEFHTPAVGDIRKVLVSLSETEPLVEKLLNYRFNTTSDLNGHAVGNLLLVALSNITGNISEGIEALSKVLKLKGKVLPLTEDNVTLVAKMKNGKIVRGEHHITESHEIIDKVYYEKEPKISPSVIQSLLDADLIVLSMGSLYTSLLPNLISKTIIKTIDKSKAKIMYVCNMMTQPGETDNFTVSDHIQVINRYLGKRKLDVVIAHEGYIDKEMLQKYETLEQKDLVELDENKIKNVKLLKDNYATVTDGVIRHDVIKLASDICAYLL